VREVAIPSVGFAMTEALLLRWTKQPGEAVSEGEPIAEVETDKTTAELEAPASGTVGRHRFAAGEVVPVGVVLTVILEPGETETDGASAATTAEVGAQLAARPQPVGTETPVAAARPANPAAEAGGPAPASATAPPRRETPRQRAAKAAGTTATDGSDRRPESVTRVRAGTHEPIPELAQRWMRDMLRIREFESRCDPLVLSGRIAGGVHLSLGQEAVAAGVASAIRPGSSTSTASGFAVWTSQKPHRRVQRSPSTRNVASRSSQHS
jgi:pyruvate/2-oxoglutarate dehydrogenase complex dihydrolipoamide acyltransferase (E2) component